MPGQPGLELTVMEARFGCEMEGFHAGREDMSALLRPRTEARIRIVKGRWQQATREQMRRGDDSGRRTQVETSVE